MPVYQYDGQHFELPDGLSNEQAIAKIKGHLGQATPTEDRDSLGKKSLGLLEAAGGMVAGLPSQIAGGLYGLSTLAAGKGIDEANANYEKTMESNFGFGAFKPSTEEGKQYTEKLGKLMNKPIEWAGDAGEFVGGSKGRLAGELGAGTLMALAPIPGAKGIAKGVESARNGMAKFSKVDRPTPPSLSKIAEALNTPEPGAAKGPEALPTIHVDGTGEATVGQMDPGTRLARQRAEDVMFQQLEEKHAAQKNQEFLGAKQEEMFGNPENFELQPDGSMAEKAVRPVEGVQGDLFPPDFSLQPDGAMAERRIDPVRGEQGDMFGQDFALTPDGEMPPRAAPTIPDGQLDLFGEKPNMYEAYEATPNGKQLSFDEYKATVSNLMKEPGTRYEPPSNLKEGYQQYLDATREKQGGLFDEGSKQEAFKEAVYQDTVPQRAAEHPFVKAADTKVAKQEALVSKMNGDPRVVPTMIARAEKELADLKERASTARENIETSLRNKEAIPDKRTFNQRTRKQGGGILVDFGKEKNNRDNAKQREELINKAKYLQEALKIQVDRSMPPNTQELGGFGKKKQTTDGSDLGRVNSQLENLKRRHIDGTLPASDYYEASRKLIEERIAIENLQKNRAENVPATSTEDVFPGYKTIPVGKIVMAVHGLNYSEPTRAKVVGTKSFRQGEKAYNLPVVDFGDGRPRTILPGDVKEVYGPKPINPLGHKEGGAIRFDWGSSKNEEFLKRVPGLKEGIKNLLPDARTVEEFKVQEAGAKDVDQNLVQRGFNMLTKGGVYQALKTNNPLVKRVVDSFLNADNRAKALTQEMVHDSYAPAARALSKAEKADTWSAIIMAENMGRPLTPEMMRDAGFNAKQQRFVEIHQNVMDRMYEQLSKSMVAAGLEPVSKRVAYAAAKARGDFRRFVYDKQGGDVIGVVGANTKLGLAKDVKRIQEKFPDAFVGEERYYGGTQSRNGTEAGFNQMLEFLSKNDPRMKEFVDIVNEMGKEDAFNYMNAKSHTMAKKGIWGTEGRKILEDSETNAKEGMEAQIRYAETMIKWGELSKAVDETKPFMDKDNGIDMPNAKAYLKDYADNALGRNPTELGRAMENLAGAFGKSTGIGVTIPTKVLSGAKSIVNGLLLGWANVPFLTANIIQPFKAMPEMKAWLESKGAKTSFDLGTGYSYMARASIDMLKGEAKASPLVKEALKYAKENHVYSSDLFEAGNSVSKDLEYGWQKGTQAGAAQIEQVTRKNMYLAMTHLLHDNGIKPEDGLFQAARRVTDMAMNNYSHVEAPMAYNAMGGAGKMAYNLMSFKHNELSRLSLFARELAKDKSAKPLLVALAGQVAFAGVLGTIGYAEADALTKFISSKVGKPTSLTKMLLDNDKVSDYLKFGMFNAVGANTTTRLGLGQVANLQSPKDMLFPGLSKVTDMAGSVGQAIGDPNEYNIKNAVRSVSPNSIVGLEDRAWFSGKDAEGNELSMNRSKVEANATRNDADKAFKTLGMQGINEYKQKTLDYENKTIDKAYQDKRTAVIEKMAQEFFTSGKINPELTKKYMEYQGDPNTLAKDIQQIPVDQKVTVWKRNLMRNAASQSITALHRAMRATGRE